jgi:hypothetical protein
MFRGILESIRLRGSALKNSIVVNETDFYTQPGGDSCGTLLQLYGRKFIYLRVQYYVGFVASRKDQQDRQSVQPNKSVSRYKRNDICLQLHDIFLKIC